MTREERIEKLRHLITCMKCEVSGKPCDDNCPTQYNAGNMGEIIENLEEIAKALEQEPCEDAISRQAVRHILNHEVKMPIKVWKKLFELVDCLPSVQPQPKTGHWIDEFGGCECSECGCLEGGYSDYCPNCGAKMRKIEVEE